MDPRISTDTREFRLELFTGKVYEPIATGPRRHLERMTEGKTQPWRIVLPEKDWPAKPTYRKPTSSRGSYGRTVQGTMQAYLTWAKERGLATVTFYDDSLGHGYGRTLPAGCTARYVDPAEFIGPAPQPEEE